MKQSNLMNRKLLFLILGMVCAAGCASLPASYDRGTKADVVLTAAPIRVKMFEAGMAADVIEGDPSQLGFVKTLVVFRVNEVLRGKLPMAARGGQSKGEQAVQAVRKKEILKLLTLDFEDPDVLVPKGWLSVAVESPLKTFGILNWDDPQPPQKIYLREVKEAPGSYILVRAEPLPD